MSLFSLNGVSFDYAGETLLTDVSFAVERGDRWGVIGRNGSGKTTLFRLIAGTLDTVSGSISRESGLRVTLLDQHRDFDDAATVWEAAAAPFARLMELERSLDAQAHDLARDASPEALARYDRDLHRFEREGGHSFHATVDAVLQGLGFDAERARTQPLDGLSGGERGRVGLARQIAAPGDVLLLDEPTNHLDLETTQWLENWLVTSGHTVLAISHDRSFLARMADHILHLEARTVIPYDAGYVRFVTIRNERREAQRRAFDQQQRKIAAEEDYIRRNIAGGNSRQAKGRRTRLARLPRLSPPPGEEGAMAVRLPAGERGGDQVVVLKDVRLEAGDRILLDAFSARVERGEVAGIIGPNGSGKSTLLHAITGERPAAAGEIVVGAGVTVAHFRQDLAQIPAAKTLFAAIHDLRPAWNRGQVQTHLGRYGFPGDEVQRIAGTLSGGEQARLALAIIVLSGANLLLFDEPTNHLDVESIEALEDAIAAYDGTVLLVSHDRTLLASLTTRIWALNNARIDDYPGSFDEWLVSRTEHAARRADEAALAAAERRGEEKAGVRRAHEQRRTAAAAKREARLALEAAEARAHAAEAAVAALTARLHDPALYESGTGAAEAARMAIELNAARRELDAALAAWIAEQEESGAG